MNDSRGQRWAGLACLGMGLGIFLVLGISMERSSVNGSCDFEPVYYHARYLIEQVDPYVESGLQYQHFKSTGYLKLKALPPSGVPDIPCVYPPTSLLLVAPLALLPWNPAHLIWMWLIAACMTVAAFLIWSASAPYSPLLSGALIGFTLANSGTVLFEANAAGLAVGLCIIAVWCFLRQRFHWAGVLCLAISLCLKPHVALFVCLYFLLAGDYRRRAAQALLVTFVLSVVAIAWVSRVSPDWAGEMRANISAISAHGSVNDHGPDSSTHLISNSAINLQTVIAVIWDEPSFYNAVTFALCGIALLVMVIATLRFPTDQPRAWLALAAVSSLSMLPIYHRHHDARLLLLAVPACAMLWTEVRPLGRAGLLVTALATAANGDIPRAILTRVEANIVFSVGSLSGKLQTIALARPAPIALSLMTIFYLWVYWRGLPKVCAKDAREANRSLSERLPA
jgi:hypothetical protein